MSLMIDYRSLATLIAVVEQGFDRDAMMILSDALDEAGRDKLALTYRLAAERRWWPFRRYARIKEDVGDEDGMVWDWDWDRRSVAVDLVPKSAQLPQLLYEAMRYHLKDKRYGTVHDAFILLMQALIHVKEI